MNTIPEEQLSLANQALLQEQSRKEQALKNNALKTAIVTAETAKNLPKAVENVVMPQVEPFVKDGRTVAELAKIVRQQAE